MRSKYGFGVTSKYSSDANIKGDLPKAVIKLELPPKTEDTQGVTAWGKLQKEHNESFGGLDSFDEFIKPYQKRPDSKPNELILDTFVLENVQRSRRSRSQVIETNERAILFVYGEQAKLYTFALRVLDGGVPLQGKEYKTNWLDHFEKFYERFGPQTIADHQLRFSISYKGNEHVGVWLNMDIQEESNFDKVAGVTFQMFVSETITPTYTIGRGRRREA